MKIHTPTITMKLLKQILRMAGGLAAVAMTGTRGLIANMQDSQTTCCKGSYLRPCSHVFVQTIYNGLIIPGCDNEKSLHAPITSDFLKRSAARSSSLLRLSGINGR